MADRTFNWTTIMFGNSSHPFFDPLWRRIALVVFCLCWSSVEFYFANTMWGFLILAIALYAGWAYLLSYDKSGQGEKQSTPQDQDAAD